MDGGREGGRVDGWKWWGGEEDGYREGWMNEEGKDWSVINE